MVSANHTIYQIRMLAQAVNVINKFESTVVEIIVACCDIWLNCWKRKFMLTAPTIGQNTLAKRQIIARKWGRSRRCTLVDIHAKLGQWYVRIDMICIIITSILWLAQICSCFSWLDWCIFSDSHWSAAVFHDWTGVYFMFSTDLQLFFLIGLVYILWLAQICSCFS